LAASSSAREGARRRNAKNNYEAAGWHMANYESTFTAFQWATARTTSQCAGVSAQLAAAPQEQAKPQNLIDLRSRLTGPFKPGPQSQSLSAVRHANPGFLCPSDQADSRTRDRPRIYGCRHQLHGQLRSGRRNYDCAEVRRNYLRKSRVRFTQSRTASRTRSHERSRSSIGSDMVLRPGRRPCILNYT